MHNKAHNMDALHAASRHFCRRLALHWASRSSAPRVATRMTNMRILFLIALLMPATSFTQASAPDSACVPYRPNKTTVRPAGSSANLPFNVHYGGNTITQSIGPGPTTDPAKKRTTAPGKKGETDFPVLI